MGKSKCRNENIDSLKGIAILMVILVHSRQGINGMSGAFDVFKFGQMGCQIFFVLSGMTSAISLKRSRNSRKFWIKRYSKIAPGYYVMILLTHVLNRFVGLGFAGDNNLISVIRNVLFIHGLFPSGNNSVMAGGWFIGTLMLFYAASPFLYRILCDCKWKKMTPVIAFLIDIALAGYINKCCGSDWIGNNSFYYFSFVTQLPCFLLGMLLGIEDVDERSSMSDCTIAIGTMVVALEIFMSEDGVWSPFKYLLCCFIVGYSTYFLIRSLDKKSELMYIPRIGIQSYYMYLTHPFWCWTLPRYLRFTINPDVEYLLLLPIECLGTYLCAVVLRKLCIPVENALYAWGSAIMEKCRT